MEIQNKVVIITGASEGIGEAPAKLLTSKGAKAILAARMTIPNLAGYASTKYMLNGLMLTAREELAKENIRVLMVYPRMTATRFAQNGINYSRFGGPRPAQTVDQANPSRPPVAGGQPIDSAEHVANRILDAIQNEPAEQFMV